LDILAVRNARCQFARLTTDHKALTDTIQEKLEALHSCYKADGQASTSTVPATAAAPQHPFARVGEVLAGSPGEAAGLCRGDLVVAFGDVRSFDVGRLSSVAESESGVSVRVVREGAVMDLALTPRSWSGAGRIGFRIEPL
jgi:26S proteasome regulatory subunit N4